MIRFNRIIRRFPAHTIHRSRYLPFSVKAQKVSDPSSTSTQSDAKTQEFKAETKKLLHIVANSLYSDKEVFCRELISNAADAMEKRRHFQLTASADSADSADSAVGSPSGPVESDGNLQIRLDLDKDAKTFTLQDSGIGMTEPELVEYLGTIARSGSKSFVENLNKGTDARESIIGQFGVGFYSAYMVGDRVTVFTRSATEGSKGYRWESDGLGSYTICEDDTAQVGTKIVIHLKDDCLEFVDQHRVEGIIQKYSNFVSFPILLNGAPVNTVQPLWSKDPRDVTDEQHKQFYRFVGKAWDDFQYKLHYKADAPFQINALLYIPERNTEVLGLSRMESGVSLYSRRVLLQSNSQKLVPDYLRFLRGVVECDDIPMNLSREMLQNSALINKLSEVITSKAIKWLQTESKQDQEKYLKFYADFGRFLKEGVCSTDSKRQVELAKLLRFETSTNENLTSLHEYVERVKEGQKNIFYLITPQRKWAEESPYFEPFQKKGYEVLFLTHSDDEFVVERLREFDGLKLTSIDSSEALAYVKDENQPTSTLTSTESQEVCDYFKEVLGKSVSEVKPSSRALSYPALITDHESPTIRKLMKMVPNQSPMFLEEAPHKLELNTEHPVIQGLARLMKDGEKKEETRDVVEQVFDNALIAAGVLDDPRVMLKRLNRLLEKSLK